MFTSLVKIGVFTENSLKRNEKSFIWKISIEYRCSTESSVMLSPTILMRTLPQIWCLHVVKSGFNVPTMFCNNFRLNNFR